MQNSLLKGPSASPNPQIQSRGCLVLCFLFQESVQKAGLQDICWVSGHCITRCFNSCSHHRAKSSGKQDFPASNPTVFKRGQIPTPYWKGCPEKACKISVLICSRHQIPVCPALTQATLHSQALQASRSITQNTLRPPEVHQYALGPSVKPLSEYL